MYKHLVNITSLVIAVMFSTQEVLCYSPGGSHMGPIK